METFQVIHCWLKAGVGQVYVLVASMICSVCFYRRMCRIDSHNRHDFKADPGIHPHSQDRRAKALGQRTATFFAAV